MLMTKVSDDSNFWWLYNATYAGDLKYNCNNNKTCRKQWCSSESGTEIFILNWDFLPNFVNLYQIHQFLFLSSLEMISI